MAHNEDIFPANQLDARTVITPGRLKQLDQRASESVNAIEGGTWTPEKKIWIGGQGVDLAALSGQLAATIETGPQAVGLILGPGRYPNRTHEDARKRSIAVTMADISYQLAGPNRGFEQKVFKRVRNPYGLQCVQTGKLFVGFEAPVDQLRMHNGATLVKVRIHMRYTRKPIDTEFLDTSTTYARIFRTPINGTVDLPPSLGNNFDLYIIPEYIPGATYAVGDVVIPSPANAGTQRQYRCVVGGISSGASSGWSSTLNATVTAGAVSFRVEPRPRADIITPAQDKHHYVTLPYESTMDATIISQFRNGLPFDLEIPVNRWTITDTDNYAYAVEIISPGSPGPIFHGMTLDFDNISTMKEP